MCHSLSSLPRLALLATGGTIAGSGPQESYAAATLGAEALLAAVPQLGTLAAWQIEQAFALDSRDFTPTHWLALAAHIQMLQADPAIAAILVTHGTDTLEETALALHLLLPTNKPVVLTAAMRPADSLSADGPLNLLQATRVALDPASRNRGVLVVANERIHAGRELAKIHTHAPDALASPASGAEGSVCGATIAYLRSAGSPRPALLPHISAEALPRVEILPGHAGMDGALLDAALAAGARGLVLALAGHGSIPAALHSTITRAVAQGVIVVRGSRIGPGVWHNHNENDDALGTIAAARLNAVQARVLLILALASGLTRTQIATLFANL